MGFLKKLFVGVIILIVILAVVGVFLPSQWEVTRTATISAPPSAIYPLLADMKNGWPQWSAFDLEDKDISYTYSGPETGEGSEREWKSEKMGDGKMRIAKADPAKGIEYTLEMAENNFLLVANMEFEQAGDATKVTWTSRGDVGGNVVYKYLIPAMDQMMGPMFEKSLANLKTKAESNTTKQ